MNGEMTPVFDWYQYFLRTPDADVIRYLKVFSMKSLDEIAALEAEMKAHPEARIPQKALAEELTRLVHGEEGLKKAQEATEALYAKKSAADVAKAENVPSASVALADCVGKPVFAVAAAAGRGAAYGGAGRPFPQRCEDRRQSPLCRRRREGRCRRSPLRKEKLLCAEGKLKG